ncbi:hypothetical protein [Ferrimicrobium sp.]|uniref:hypothetical protein n=1 Tax=Ferrimicrobium sp. TaxID=2926050 RepID=UPI0026221543|nr:hypothetical protein [Ferrimicrobium sp.]
MADLRPLKTAEWLKIWTDLGQAPRTIDGYAHGLAEYLDHCERNSVGPLLAGGVQHILRSGDHRPARP